MKRPIKFRGWDIQRKEWVYGYYSTFGNSTFITEPGKLGIPEQHIEVDPESVGEFTGLSDKNKQEIYEGDIVNSFREVETGVVKFGVGMFYLDTGSNKPLLGGWLAESAGVHEVIGNVFENADMKI